MSKETILKRIDKEWHSLYEAIGELSDEELLRPRAAGEWSVRDILAHIATWDNEALKALPIILKGQKPPLYSTLYGGIDQYNRQEQERKSRLSLAQVKRELAEAHRKLMSFLETVPEEAFNTGTRFRRRLSADSYAHYPEHVRAIKQGKAVPGKSG